MMLPISKIRIHNNRTGRGTRSDVFLFHPRKKQVNNKNDLYRKKEKQFQIAKQI